MKKKFVKYDQEKTDFTMLNYDFLEGVSKVLMHGAKKYSRENWKLCGKEEGLRRYKAALLRHTLAYVNDNETVDPESGMFHLYHLTCCAQFLSYFEGKRKAK
jgi:hypothetical protein